MGALLLALGIGAGPGGGAAAGAGLATAGAGLGGGGGVAAGAGLATAGAGLGGGGGGLASGLLAAAGKGIAVGVGTAAIDQISQAIAAKVDVGLPDAPVMEFDESKETRAAVVEGQAGRSRTSFMSSGSLGSPVRVGQPSPLLTPTPLGGR